MFSIRREPSARSHEILAEAFDGFILADVFSAGNVTQLRVIITAASRGL
jgi:hypothetical protein